MAKNAMNRRTRLRVCRCEKRVRGRAKTRSYAPVLRHVIGEICRNMDISGHERCGTRLLNAPGYCP